jgi:hypothetical protein
MVELQALLLLLLLLALSLSGCTAFQISRPPTQHFALTTLSSSNNNSFDDLDGIGKLSEIYEIDKNNNNAAFSTTPNSQPIQPPTRRKFTGASSSQSIFTTNNNNEQSSSSSSPPSSNLQREREREFNLASNFERTFGIQAILLLASLIGVISVGLSGGITDGSERIFYGEDEVDSVVIEQIERMRTNDATEVLLRQESSIRI